MARGFNKGKYGRFETSTAELSAVANGPDAELVCEQVGRLLAADCMARSGRQYEVDTARGRFRIHTRVTTGRGGKQIMWKGLSWGTDYFYESKHRVLASTSPHMP